MVDPSKKSKKPIQGSLKVRGSGSRKVPSFNDSMMRYVGIPIVWCWLLCAMTIIFMGITAPDKVMPMLEGFIALLAIIGTLSTLIVTSMLELWKTEQMKEVDVIPARLTHSILLDGEERRHSMEIEKLKLALEAEDSIAFLHEMNALSHTHNTKRESDGHFFDPVPLQSNKKR
jgi:hypothetical protein